MTVDHDILSGLSEQLGNRAAELASNAYAEIGREVNLGSPKQLQEVLFDQLAMPKTRANKTGFSTDAGALADLQEKSPHPFLGLLLEHREVELEFAVDVAGSRAAPGGKAECGAGAGAGVLLPAAHASASPGAVSTAGRGLI